MNNSPEYRQKRLCRKSVVNTGINGIKLTLVRLANNSITGIKSPEYRQKTKIYRKSVVYTGMINGIQYRLKPY